MTRLEEKIAVLEEQIRATPYNKASEAHVGRLKAKLAELKRALEKKSKKKPGRVKTIKKAGDATIVLVGNAEKREELLTSLAGVAHGSHLGMMIFRGAHIQLIDPEDRDPSEVKAALHIADLAVSLGELPAQLKKIPCPLIVLSEEEPAAEVRESIWDSLGMMRVYTKEPGKPPEKREPMILKRDSTIRDVCASLHKDFLRYFRHARVWGRSAKFPGQRFGLPHKLEDEDIVELSFKK